MMKLYYTTVVEEGATQQRPDLSLGGFKSFNSVPNASLHNLFSDVSIYSIISNRSEYIALILKNETGVEIKDISLYFIYPTGGQIKLAIGAVALSGNNSMEHIDTPYQSPYNAEFFEADGAGAAVDLGGLVVEGMLGLWIRKTINQAAIETQYSDANLTVNGNPVQAEEDVQIKLSWSNLSSSHEILTYSFPQQIGVASINPTNHTVGIEVVNGTSLAALVATFTLSPFSSVKVGAVHQVSGSTANSFTSPVSYTVTAEDGATQVWTVTVTVA